MSTKSTGSALQVPVVVNPIATIIVQESSKRSVGRSAERVKEFSIVCILHVQDNPMLSWRVVRVGVADEQGWRFETTR